MILTSTTLLYVPLVSGNDQAQAAFLASKPIDLKKIYHHYQPPPTGLLSRSKKGDLALRMLALGTDFNYRIESGT